MDAYFPEKPLRAVAMAGAVSLIVLTLLLLIPHLSRYGMAIEVVGLIGAEVLYWFLHVNILLQLLALGAAVCTPVVVVSLFLQYCLKKKDTAFQKSAGDVSSASQS